MSSTKLYRSAILPSSAFRPLGTNPPCSRPVEIAKSKPARSAPLIGGDLLVRGFALSTASLCHWRCRRSFPFASSTVSLPGTSLSWPRSFCVRTSYGPCHLDSFSSAHNFPRSTTNLPPRSSFLWCRSCWCFCSSNAISSPEWAGRLNNSNSDF